MQQLEFKLLGACIKKEDDISNTEGRSGQQASSVFPG